MKGWIYILTNQSVPNWLAIACADTDPAALVHQYGQAGIKLPYPFELQYALRTPYAQTMLQKIHEQLTEERVNPEHNQDWFECDLLRAIRLVRQIAGQSATGEAFYAQARQLVEQSRHRIAQTETPPAPAAPEEESPASLVRTTPIVQYGKRAAPLAPRHQPPPQKSTEQAPPKEESKWLILFLIVVWVMLMVVLVFLAAYVFNYI